MISRSPKTVADSFILARLSWRLPCILALTLALSATPSRAQTIGETQFSDTTSDSHSDDLSRARSAVEKLFERSGNMVCTEKVTQSILDPYGKPNYEEHSLFNYRFEADSGGKSFRYVETRERLQAPYRDTGRTLVLTDGFGNLLLILHPAYAANYKFEYAGDENVGGVSTVRFRFTSLSGASTPIMLRVGEQNYSVALDGTVWIEAGSGNVVKVSAFSGSSMTELGIRKISSEVQYARTEFNDPQESYWMPDSATIEVETARRHWRNIHKFSEYKRLPAAAAPRASVGNQ